MQRWALDGEESAVALLVAARGSTPLPAGARFAVSSTGKVAGSVSSGCVESDLHQTLSDILHGDGGPRLRSYGIGSATAPGGNGPERLGSESEALLPCGGEIDVWLQRHDPADPAWRALGRAVSSREGAVLLTCTGGPAASRTVLVTESGVRGSFGSDALDGLVRRELDQFARAESPRMVQRSVEGDAAGLPLFVEPWLPKRRLVIVGATPIGEALCGPAQSLGFEVTVVDPRTAFLAPERFPAANLTDRWPDEAISVIGLRESDSVVVLTHDQKLDIPALAAALHSECGYVGLLGGRRTQRSRREALGQEGVPEQDIERLHGPVGLDIGSRSPGR